MIWIAFACLTAACVICVLWPIARGRQAATQASVASAFYQSQTQAIEQDRKAGLISPTDAVIATTEAARRALGARGTGEARVASRPAVWFSALFATVGIPAFAMAFYLRTGSPDMPDQPLATRISAKADVNDVGALVARMEAHLAAHPDDGKAQAMIAPVYLRLGRAEEAANAYRLALLALGETAIMRADYAESLVAAADGDVTPEAVRNFDLALATDPALPKARFYLGIAAERAGDIARAIETYQQLVAGAPPQAAYVAVVQRQLGLLQSNIARGKVTTPAENIAALPEAERTATIRGMVEGLAARLAQNGNDTEGWLRLVRAFKVLHEDARAATAVSDARKALAADTGALGRVNALAGELGIAAP